MTARRKVKKVTVPTVRSPIGVDRTSPSPFSPVGAPGVAIHGGFIFEGEKDSALTGQQKYLTYSDILANVTIVAAGVRFFLNLVAKAKWSAEPADDSEEAKRLADLVQNILYDMKTPWHRVVRRAALYKFYGFAILEWTAKIRDDGVIGFESIDNRSQRSIDRWDVDQFGRVLGVVQVSPQDSRDIYLPRGKIVHLVDDSLHDSPEGLGLFRHLAKAAKRLERYELLEAWGYETDLRGIPIGRAPLSTLEEKVKNGDMSPEDAAATRRPVEGFIRSHNRTPALGMMLDSAPYKSDGEARTVSSTRQWDIELLKGEGSPHEEVAAAIERTMHEIARVLGVEHLLLGGNDRGSYALSADKSQAFSMIVESALIEIRDTFKADLLVPLFALNGWDPKLMPSFKTDQISYRSIQEVTAALKDLAAAGAPMAPEDPAIAEIYNQIGLTPPDPNSPMREILLQQAEVLAMPPPEPEPPSDSPAPSE